MQDQVFQDNDKSNYLFLVVLSNEINLGRKLKISYTLPGVYLSSTLVSESSDISGCNRQRDYIKLFYGVRAECGFYF